MTQIPFPAPAAPAVSSSAARRVVALSTLGFTLMFAAWVMFAIVGLPIRKQLGLV